MPHNVQHLPGSGAFLGMPLSAAAFARDAISAETAQLNAAGRQQAASAPKLWDVTPARHRAESEAGRGLYPLKSRSELASERSIPGPGGPLRLHVLTPPKVTGVHLYFHGGGWVLGGAHLHDAVLEDMARRTNMAVVSVHYRLAPEHPYPAATDDAEAAALWLVNHAPREFGTTRLTIGGESAGAQLSVCALLRLRDRHGCRAFLGANLVFGVYDLSLTPSARQTPDGTAALGWLIDQFAPQEKRRHPDMSPLYANLEGLTPALFTVGTHDPLLDDTLFMHARWLAAGNCASLALYPGGVHGFNSFPSSITTDAHARGIAFLNERVAGGTTSVPSRSAG